MRKPAPSVNNSNTGASSLIRVTLTGQLQLDLLLRRVQAHDPEAADLAGAGGLALAGSVGGGSLLPSRCEHGRERGKIRLAGALLRRDRRRRALARDCTER